MDFDTALYKAITGGRAPGGENLSVPATIAEIERAMRGPVAGRVGRAATAAQTPARTWRAWKAGRVPKPEGLSRLRLTQRRLRLVASREAWLRKHPAIVIYAEVRISTDISDRKLRPSLWRDSKDKPPAAPLIGMVSRTLDKWLKRHDISAGDTFMAPVHEHIGYEVELLDVYEIKFFRTEEEATQWCRNRR